MREPSIPERAAGPREVGTPSRVAILGHPLHAVLIVFPIAFLIGALGSDLGFWLTGDAFWARASHWLLGAGVVTAALAGLVGLTDFLTIRRVRRLREAWYHFLGNAALMVLALANYLLRFGDQQDAVVPVGFLLSALTALGLMVTGYLGGRLAHHHLIGVRGSVGDEEARPLNSEAPRERQESPGRRAA
jgi:uncharacterized membrane protein